MLDQVAVKKNLLHGNAKGSMRFSSSSFANDASGVSDHHVPLKHGPMPYSSTSAQVNPLQFHHKPAKSLNKSISHAGQVNSSLSQIKLGMPPELIYTQEERNCKLQI